MQSSRVLWPVLFSFFMAVTIAVSVPMLSPGSAGAASQKIKKQKVAVVDDTILIKFAPGIDSALAKSLLQARGVKVEKVFRNLSAVNGQLYLTVLPEERPQVKGAEIELLIQELAKTPEIETVDQNYEIHIIDPFKDEKGNHSKSGDNYSNIAPDFVADDPLYSQLWGLQNMDMQTAWDIETGSENVVVFVIDTGIDTNHPDLVANLWSNLGEIPGNGIDDDSNGYIDDVHGIDTYNNDSDPEDDHSHGTHVSGTIGAQGNNAIGVVGVNWEVKIGACKFLSAYGGGWTDDAVECFDYILGLRNAGVNVVATNNSWGGGGFSQTLHDAIEANIAAGVLPVMAAGNSGSSNDSIPHYPSSYTFPDVQGDSISVAAIDSSNNLAGFSCYGLTSVDVAAPGVSILSTLPGNAYGSKNGTSMATPHVVGLAALIAADEPGSSLAEIRQAILCGTVSTPSLAGKIVTGGKVNAYNSLQAHCPPSVSITAPEYLSVVSGDVSITADASSEYDIAQVEFFVNDSSVGVDSTAPYSIIWNASASAPDMYTVKAVATDTDGVVNSDEVKVYLVSGCSGQALILDLGSDNGSGIAIGAALARNNISPIHADSIVAVDPAEYPLVFVALGYYSGQHVLTVGESEDLSSYLDNGGMLYMEGGDTWYWDPDRPIHDYFGIIGIADGSANLATVNGIIGSLADGLGFTSTGINTWVDHLQPVNGGVAVWENSSPSYIAGVSNQTAVYRTIGCSFEFGNIPDQATQMDVMAAYLSFFEYTSVDAKFEANAVSSSAPLTVNFTDLSTAQDITDWSWDFDGDGVEDSSDPNPAYTYFLSGCYTVSLTITTADGETCTETKECYIEVTADLVSVDTKGMILIKKNLEKRDTAWFKITGMSDLDTVAGDPFLLRFQVGTADQEPAYSFIAASDDFQIIPNSLLFYHDSEVKVLCWLNRDKCLVTVNRSDINEELLSEDMTLSFEIDGYNYAETNTWSVMDLHGTTTYTKQ